MSSMDRFLSNLRRLLRPRARPPDPSIGQPTAERPPPPGSAPSLERAFLDVIATGEVGSDNPTPIEPAAEDPAPGSEPYAEVPPPASKPTPIVPSAADVPSAPTDQAALVLMLATPAATFTVARSAATLGRGQENTIRLEDLSVSRRHARIAYRQGGYWLSDLGSMGGTWVDGAKLNAPRRIAAGQIIDIGVCRLTVSFSRSTVAAQGRRRR
jgi:hypothetical protein